MTVNSKTSDMPIRVLIVEDSTVTRHLLTHILSADPGIEVLGAVESGEDALKVIKRTRPDVITMDVYLPGMDGFETTRTIMATDPVPIVVVSSSCDTRQMEVSFEALEAGALTAVNKPDGPGSLNYAQRARELVKMVKLMAEVKVIKRRHRKPEQRSPLPKTERINRLPGKKKSINLVAMGASTGGPPVLHQILSELPADFPTPIVIVQHIARGFIHGLAEWLGQSTAMPVHVAEHGQRLRPGHIYFAPDENQLTFDRQGKIRCSDGRFINNLRPSVASLFESTAEHYGTHAVAVLLTGMGKDGASELLTLKDKGAVTIAQDRETSRVFGMPGEAVRLNAATHILPSHKIAAMLIELVMP